MLGQRLEVVDLAPGEDALAVGLGVLVVALDWFVVAAQTVLTARIGEGRLFLLRTRSFAHLQRLGLDFYERELGGRIMTRMTTDVDALSTFLQTGLAQAFVALLTIIGVAVALLVTDVELALVALAVMPVLIVATVIFRRLSSAAYNEARERVSVVNADLQENVAGLRVAQAHTHEELSAATFADNSDAYRRARLRAQRLIATYFPFAAMLSDLAQAAVLGVGAARVATGGLSPGILAAFLLYLAMFFGPVQQLSQVFDGYQQARVGLTRIGELLRTPTSVPMPEHPVVVGDLRGEVELRDVGFSYAGADTPALVDFSLHVPAGQTVALVGATGAGKSTVVKLVARFYDASAGSVLIDGVDVREHDLPWIWRESPLFSAFRGTDWMPDPCRSCDRREVDLGGCRCQAFQLTGDMYRTDPVCVLSPDRHIVDEAVAAANDPAAAPAGGSTAEPVLVPMPAVRPHRAD